MLKSISSLLSKPYIAVLYTILLCILLFSPSTDLADVEQNIVMNDKVAHGLAFLGLSFLWNYVLNNVFKTTVALFIFAIFTEFVQYSLPHSFMRSFELYDIFADSLGIIGGSVASQWVKSYMK